MSNTKQIFAVLSRCNGRSIFCPSCVCKSSIEREVRTLIFLTQTLVEIMQIVIICRAIARKNKNISVLLQ
jgi:hypothetical protein